MDSRIAVLNAGSSTLKCALFEQGAQEPIWKGLLEKRQGRFWVSASDEQFSLAARDYSSAALKFLSFAFMERGEISAVGHRIVHGGEKFTTSTLLTPATLKALAKLSPLAPLHNPLNLQGVEWVKQLLPKIPQVGVFDTAFHHHLPPEHYTYAVPLAWLKKGIRRYGFHGINHQACYEHLRGIDRQAKKKKIITCHLGNGCSLAAIQLGVSIDTTMGFTPMEGLVMGSRSGSLDPGIIFHLLRNHVDTPAALEKILNHEAGLKAIAGTHDMREILKRKHGGEQRAKLAFALFCHSLGQHIAMMAASMGGVDTLIFTGGIGENATEIRATVCELLQFMGVLLDQKKNSSLQNEGKISHTSSKVEVYVFKSREEYLIAQETALIVSKRGDRIHRGRFNSRI